MMTGSPHPALGPETQLLLLTSGISPPLERIRRLLDQPLDWSYLAWLAARQRALPQLWQHVNMMGADRVPERVRAEVQPVVMVADFTMHLLRERFDEAAKALESAGVRVMVLKGAALALTHYRSFADRPMGDIDLLVDADATGTALHVLRDIGWIAEFDTKFERFYADHHHLAPLRYGGSEVRLELHTDLFAAGHPFVLPVGDLWSRARQVPVGRSSVQVPDPVDTMIHLCAHFLWSHGGISGVWRAFRDVDALLRSDSLSWDDLVDRAIAARAGTCVYWTLRLARNAGGIEVAAPELDRLRPRRSEFVLNRLEHHLATSLFPSSRSCPSMTLARLMWSAVVQPRRSGHGKSRPWSRSQLVRETFLLPQDRSFLGRAAAQTQRLRAWGRYFAALFRSPAPRALI